MQVDPQHCLVLGIQYKEIVYTNSEYHTPCSFVCKQSDSQ